MSEIQTDEAQPPDFTRALNSMMDNLENVVVNFQKALLVMLEKIEKLESLEKSSRGNTSPNEKGPTAEEIKQLKNNAATSEMSHQESSETHNETTDTGTNLQQPENEIHGSTSLTVNESGISKRSIFTGILSKIIQKISSKSNYCILAIALAVLGVIIVKLYFMLFP